MAVYYLRLLLLISVVIGIVAVIGSLLPRSYDFSSVAVIKAEPDIVFEKINTMRSWAEWSQWSPQQIEGLQVEYSKTAAGVGAAQSWTDPRGDGKLWIVESVPKQRVEYRLEFGGFPQMTSSIELTPIRSGEDESTHTQVTWSSKGTLPSGPFYGYFSPFFANGMRQQYNESLARLKKQAESKPGQSTFSSPRKLER